MLHMKRATSPKKKGCNTCVAYEEGNIPEEKYREHMKRAKKKGCNTCVAYEEGNIPEEKYRVNRKNEGFALKEKD